MKDLFKKVKYLFVGLLVLLMTGCDNSNIESVDFEAQYVRTDGSVGVITEPRVVKIESVNKLNKYYDDNADDYDFASSFGDSVSFTTAIDKYDEKYFENSFLLVVLLEEEGSDIYHKVSAVSKNGKILIERNIPDSDSRNVVSWHMLIELDKEYIDTEYSVKLENVEK